MACGKGDELRTWKTVRGRSGRRKAFWRESVTGGLLPWGIYGEAQRMKTPADAASSSGTLETFRKGQVWRIGDLNLAVTLVGKTLVHYKRYKTKRHGNQTALSSKPDLEKYLRLNNAVLVSE